MSDDEDGNYLDVSLDEEDEELIWRVFFGDKEAYESGAQGDIDVDASDSEEYQQLQREVEELKDMAGLEDVDPELAARFKQLIKEEPDRDMSEADKKQLLSLNLTPEQMARFETYREMKLNRPGVKKICNGVLGHLIPNNIAVILLAVSKSFLGEIITRAMEIQKREAKGQLLQDVEAKKKTKADALRRIAEGEEAVEVEENRLQYLGDEPSTLQPYHVREAWRLYQLENSLAINPQWRYQGDADGKYFR